MSVRARADMEPPGNRSVRVLVREEEVHVEVGNAALRQRHKRRRGRNRALGPLVALAAQTAMREDTQSGERSAVTWSPRCCDRTRSS